MCTGLAISFHEFRNRFRFPGEHRLIKCTAPKNGFTEFAQRLSNVGFVRDEIGPTGSTHARDIIRMLAEGKEKLPGRISTLTLVLRPDNVISFAFSPRGCARLNARAGWSDELFLSKPRHDGVDLTILVRVGANAPKVPSVPLVNPQRGTADVWFFLP